MKQTGKELAATLALLGMGMSPQQKQRADCESKGIPIGVYFRRSIKQRWKRWRRLGR